MFGRFASRFAKASGGRTVATASLQGSAASWNKLAVLAGVVGGASALYYSTRTAEGFGYVEDCLEPPVYDWGWTSMLKSYDHAALRRGFQVYLTIGNACHSMKHVHYRQLVDIAYTEKEMIENTDYLDEPDETGEVPTRPGTLNDPLHAPYQNEKEARYSNNGALPPDLSLIVRARPHGENYIFALLTGYRDPPHGIKMNEGMYYNIYFPGTQISMPPPLAAGAVEFDDGTEASVSQMAKDVTEYLTWSSLMELDERHKMGIKTLAAIVPLCGLFLYWKKWKWAPLKQRSVKFLRPWEKK